MSGTGVKRGDAVRSSIGRVHYARNGHYTACSTLIGDAWDVVWLGAIVPEHLCRECWKDVTR